MDDEWIEANVAPELTGATEREWTPDALSRLVARLGDKISAAVSSGELSREGARRARERIGAVMKTIPGVTSHGGAIQMEPITVRGTEKRQEK